MTDRTESGAHGDVAEVVAEWVRAASAITVLTGAGISTDSGIPDFRGPDGVWTRDPEAQRLSDLRSYVEDPALRRRAWLGRRDHTAWHARPNSGHQALVDLQRAGRLRAVITQNIDELHQRAGNDPDLVIELHGTIFGVTCLSCHERTTMESALARVSAGEDDPPCLRCGGILKSATISFGQELDQSILRRATYAAADCDLFLAVGSSLTVRPAAGLVTVAASAGAKVVVLNGQPTPYDATADAVLRGPIGDLLPPLVAAAA